MAKVLTEEPSRFQITLCGVDWPRYIKSISGLKKTSRMSVIRAEINYSDSQTSSSETLAQQITLEKDAEKRRELVMEYVGLVIKEWTGISSSSEVDLNNSLYNYGIDSAGALTLKMQLESNLQVSFEVCFFKLGRFVFHFRPRDIPWRLFYSPSSKGLLSLHHRMIDVLSLRLNASTRCRPTGDENKKSRLQRSVVFMMH